MTELLAFPRTRHLTWLGSNSPRDDKVMSEAEAEEFLRGDVVLEEKVDGANIGLSLGQNGAIRARNRGTWLGPGAHPQFEPLWAWVAARSDRLREHLGPTLVLFGEWVFAVHSVRYAALPDWFLAFDVYSRAEGRFWSTRRRDELLSRLGVSPVPRVQEPAETLEELRRLVESLPSQLGAPRAEGIYLRREDDQHLIARAKLVRSDFLAADEPHWTKRALERNRLATDGQPC